jgi:hypothetical protein
MYLHINMKHGTRQKVGWVSQMLSAVPRRAPIGRGENNRPELGGWAGKFKRHVVELQSGIVDTYHPATLLRARFGIVQQEGLAHMEFRVHFQQTAMGIDNLGFRLFPQLAVLDVLGQDDHSHVEHDPFASPSILWPWHSEETLRVAFYRKRGGIGLSLKPGAHFEGKAPEYRTACTQVMSLV